MRGRDGLDSGSGQLQQLHDRLAKLFFRSARDQRRNVIVANFQQPTRRSRRKIRRLKNDVLHLSATPVPTLIDQQTKGKTNVQPVLAAIYLTSRHILLGILLVPTSPSWQEETLENTGRTAAKISFLPTHRTCCARLDVWFASRAGLPVVCHSCPSAFP